MQLCLTDIQLIIDSLGYHFHLTDVQDEHDINMTLVESIQSQVNEQNLPDGSPYELMLSAEDIGRVTDSLTYHFEMTDNQIEHEKNLQVLRAIDA